MIRDAYDRIEHAALADGGVIAHYENAGKWFLEYPDSPDTKRRQVKLAEAVELAIQPGAAVRLNVAGGMAFEAKYRRAKGLPKRRW